MEVLREQRGNADIDFGGHVHCSHNMFICTCIIVTSAHTGCNAVSAGRGPALLRLLG